MIAKMTFAVLGNRSNGVSLKWHLLKMVRVNDFRWNVTGSGVVVGAAEEWDNGITHPAVAQHWRWNDSDGGGGGGTTDFWHHSFHATPIGLMLKFRI